MSHPAWTLGARTGPVRRHRQLVFFACEGLIALFDERAADEDYVILRPDEFDERARALNDFANKIGKSDPAKWQRQESREQRQAAQHMTETAKEARFMGDPSDPGVQAFWAKHRRQNRVAFNAKPASVMTVEEMAAQGLGTKTTGVPDMTAADLSAMKIHSKPTRKPRGDRKLILSDDLL